MQGITPRETSFGIWEAHDGEKNGTRLAWNMYFQEKLSSWLLQQHKDSHTYVHFSLGSTTSSRFQKQENLLKLNKVTTVWILPAVPLNLWTKQLSDPRCKVHTNWGYKVFFVSQDSLNPISARTSGLVSLAANNLPPHRGIWKSITHFMKEINIDQVISYSLKLLHKSQSNGL